VIKVQEPKGGDIARRNVRDQDSDSPFFLLLNANKRSLTLNLKTARGKELLKELIAKSDVLVENFSPGERSTGSASACSRHCSGATIRTAATGRGDPSHCLASIPRLRRAKPAASPSETCGVAVEEVKRARGCPRQTGRTERSFASCGSQIRPPLSLAIPRIRLLAANVPIDILPPKGPRNVIPC
jgi:hypothetical protein